MGSYSETPPFPHDIPTAPLFKLSLQKLASRDPIEAAQLFTAAKETGFFYLNLDDMPEGRSILSDAGELFRVAGPVFDESNGMKETLRPGTTSTGWVAKGVS